MHVLEVYQDLLCLAFLVSWSPAVEGEEGREGEEWGEGGREEREGR